MPAERFVSPVVRADPERSDLGRRIGLRRCWARRAPAGRSLRRELGNQRPSRDDVSRVRNGPLAGATLRDLIRERGDELLGVGRSRTKPEQFPLLVKFLDAREVLSVQVHPNDVQGRLLANDNGKTEAWVIVHADPGSLIYAGLKPGVSRDDFAAALGTPAVEPLLHRFPARAGDCIMIPAGTVHAIGAGVVLAEIQQMSDATFRVHDWGRVGPDGKPRALHLAEAARKHDRLERMARLIHWLRNPSRCRAESGKPWPLATISGSRGCF